MEAAASAVEEAAADFKGVFFMSKKAITILTVIACVLAVAAVVIGLYFKLESIYRSLLMAPAAILIVIAFFFSTKVK